MERQSQKMEQQEKLERKKIVEVRLTIWSNSI
jgi:hypothetical protein